MRTRAGLLLALSLSLLAAAGCGMNRAPRTTAEERDCLPLAEHSVRVLEVEGAVPDWEISGLCWWGDELLLLPQFPDRVGGILLLSRADLSRYLASEEAPALRPRRVPLEGADLGARVPGFDGFEAVAARDGVLYLTVEADGEPSMEGWVVQAVWEAALGRWRLEPESLSPIPLQTTIHNVADEAIVLHEDEVLTLHEANGANVNPHPVAHRYGDDLRPRGTMAFPTVEYRITDATAPDAQGRFWALNHFYPAEYDRLRPARDQLVVDFGVGPTHAEWAEVERLVEFVVWGDRIERTHRPPVQFTLLTEDISRNWEGVARWGEEGFLCVTDRYPGTLLAYVDLRPCSPAEDE